jgi:tetratricopeptide (TPR) repeat protein
VLVAALAVVACEEANQGRDARARFEQAVADQDPSQARAAAVDLERELPDSADAVIEVARMLADIGEMNEARWMLEEARARHPERTDLILGLAETSLRVGDASGALAALQDVPEDAEESAYAEVLRARAQVQLGELEEGLATLDRAQAHYDDPLLFRLERIDLLAGEHRAREALATVREIQADPRVQNEAQLQLAVIESDLLAASEGADAALAPLDEIWAAHPGAPEVAAKRTSLLVAQGRAAEALRDLRVALEADPEALALYVLGAQAALATGDVPAAEVLLRRHLEIDVSAASLRNLALFLDRLGRASEAANLLAELPELDDPLQRIELRYLAIALRIDAGDLARARRDVAAFGREHPRNPRYGYLLARLELAEGDPQAAAKRLGEVLTRLDRPDVKHLLAVALERLGDRAGAELRYGLAALENPQQIPSWLGLLRMLEAQGKWERAADVAMGLVRLAPAVGSAYQVLANAKIALGRPDEAETLLRDYVGRNPNRHGPRAALSLALRRQGRPAEALAVLDGAGADAADDPVLAGERAVVLGQLGRLSEAFEVLDSMQEEGRDARALRHARIYLLFLADRGDEALAEAGRAAALDDADPVPHRMEADYLASRGRFEESVEPYRRALERATDAGVAFRLGVALEGAGRDADAIDAYRRAIEIDERAVGPRNNLALVLARVGATREALEMAQSAYARAETDPVVMDTLASLYRASGLAGRAAALLEKARRSDSESAEIAYHLALAYRDAQRPDDARALLIDLGARLEPEHALRGAVDAALASLR